MAFQLCVDAVKTSNPAWKSNSRILGRAAEIYCCSHLKCPNCSSCDWLECVTNEKSKDQICRHCNKQFQIKCKKMNRQEYRRLVDTRIFKTVGAEYQTTLKSLEDKIDYIALLYTETYDVHEILHIKERPPLAQTARRAGWQGCNLVFPKFEFIHDKGDHVKVIIPDDAAHMILTTSAKGANKSLDAKIFFQQSLLALLEEVGEKFDISGYTINKVEVVSDTPSENPNECGEMSVHIHPTEKVMWITHCDE